MFHISKKERGPFDKRDNLMSNEDRSGKKQHKSEHLYKFSVSDADRELGIFADKNLQKEAHASALKWRQEIDKYGARDPKFLKAVKPVRVSFSAPKIVKDMATAAKRAHVGPMAALAGAMAEYVGRDLLRHSKEVIVESSGNIFLKAGKARRVVVHAGASPFSGKIALEIEPDQTPVGVCTSSDASNHPLSFGHADAVVVIAKSTALADAVATYLGNMVKTVSDISGAINIARKIRGLSSVLIIKGDHIGAWGRMKIIPI